MHYDLNVHVPYFLHIHCTCTQSVIVALSTILDNFYFLVTPYTTLYALHGCLSVGSDLSMYAYCSIYCAQGIDQRRESRFIEE